MPYQIEMIKNSEIFERLTGKIQPSLSHPTSKAFDPNAWIKTIDIKGASIEDKRLLTAAIYLGDQIKTLRQFHVDELFHGFSSIDVVRLAIGSANRAVIMTRRKLRSAKFLDENENAKHIAAISSIRLETVFSDQTPDDISVAAIDSLPHWFAQAVDCDDQIQHKLSKKIHYRNISAKAAACMSLEKSLRDLWQQALWEGWILDIKSEKFLPKSFDEAALWYAWKQRQSVIANQGLNFDHFFEVDGGDHPPIMQKVVSNVKISGGRFRIRLAPPNLEQRTHHYYVLEMARKSYLGPFLDELIDGKDNTFRNLLHAWLLLKTLADALTSNCKNFEFEKYSDFKRFSFEMHEEQLRKLFSECLHVSSDRAARLQKCLTLDPDNIPDAFKWGAWHRPLVRNAEKNRVMILTATLQSADIIYVMERWSSAFGLTKKIEAHSIGHAYEKSVRELLISSIEENEILSDAQISKTALSRHTAGESRLELTV